MNKHILHHGQFTTHQTLGHPQLHRQVDFAPSCSGRLACLQIAALRAIVRAPSVCGPSRATHRWLQADLASGSAKPEPVLTTPSKGLLKALPHYLVDNGVCENSSLQGKTFHDIYSLPCMTHISLRKLISEKCHI